MGSDVNIKSYHVKHRLCLGPPLLKKRSASRITHQNKKNRKVLPLNMLNILVFQVPLLTKFYVSTEEEQSKKLLMLTLLSPPPTKRQNRNRLLKLTIALHGNGELSL